MKKFNAPAIEIEKFDMVDVITASVVTPTDPDELPEDRG